MLTGRIPPLVLIAALGPSSHDCMIASLGIRARCPSLYKHAANAISNMGKKSGDTGGDGKATAWRVYVPAGVPIVRRIAGLTDALGLRIILLL